MLKCNKCGAVFADVGIIECPECGNRRNIAEIEQCKVCREYHTSCINGICKDCRERSATIETALGMGDVYTYPVELNGFLTYVFGKDRIEEILKRELEHEPKNVIELDAEKYCFDDVYQYTDYLCDMENEKRNQPKRKVYQRRGKLK